MRKSNVLIALLLLFVLSISICFVKAGSYLSSAVSPPSPSDLIVLLSGDAGARSQTGLELFNRGYGKYILLTGLEDGERAIQPYYLNWRAQFLLDSGVNKDRILTEGRAKNSWEEARYTLALMKQRKWKSLVVVSDPPHLRRLQWVWGKIFRDSDIKVAFAASKPSWWDEKKWWENEHSVKFVVMEYLKLAYYHLKY